MAALSGTPGEPRREDCVEYVFMSPTTMFRVQASRSQPLLLLGEEVSFRPAKGSLRVRRDDETGEFDVSVVCMRLRSANYGGCVSVDDDPKMTAKRPR
jgi:hypothetical protein